VATEYLSLLHSVSFPDVDWIETKQQVKTSSVSEFRGKEKLATDQFARGLQAIMGGLAVAEEELY